MLQTLDPQDGRVYVDMTFGHGGHSEALLSSGKHVLIFALDRDPAAFVRAQQLATRFPGQLIPMLGRFSDMKQVFRDHRIKEDTIDGVLIDVGADWHNQLCDPHRGFCPNHSSTSVLDMRMDGQCRPDIVTAFDVIHTLNDEDLARIFVHYGNEKRGRKFANLVLDARQMLGQIRTAGELAYLIRSIGGKASESNDEREDTRTNDYVDGDSVDRWNTAGGPVARLFYALRVFVNNELNELDFGLRVIRPFLKVDAHLSQNAHLLPSHAKNDTELIRCAQAGRLVVISYSGPEDSIVKSHLSWMGSASKDEPQTLALFNARARSSIASSVQQDSIAFRNMNWLAGQKHVIRLPVELQSSYPPPYRSAKLRTALRLT